MRLRLVINRNGLPTMKIWWDTSSFQPGDDRNISSLLARVSQIVPLESSRWGLEDYAVEIGGFECLHFQEVESVIREGDEVIIRPLSSHEIKQRRLSGRRQISTSGRKLIDGTPFGRSFLRPAPDRPTLAIPPRKRRRIGHADADDSITVQVGSETDESYTEDKETEEEDVSSDDDNDDEEEVVERRLVPVGENIVMNSNYLLEKGEDGDDEDEEEEEAAARSGGYDNPLMDYYYDAAGEIESELDEEEELRRIVEEGSSSPEKDESLSKTKNIPINILAAEVDSSDSSDDEDFDPDVFQSSDSSSDEEDREEEEVAAQVVTPVVEDPQTQSINILGVTAPSDDESSDSDFNPRTITTEVSSEDEAYSSSEPSSSSSSSSSSEESSSQSSSSEEEEDESEDEIVFQPKKTTPQRQKQNPQSYPPSSSSSSSSPELQQQKVSPRPKGPPVSPGSLPNEGRRATKARNQRKNENRKLRKLKESGVVPIDMSHAEYLAWVAGKQVAVAVAEETPKHTEPAKIVTPAKEATPAKGPKPPKSEEAVKSANRRKRYRKIYNKAKKAGTTDLDFDKWTEEREKQHLADLEKGKGEGEGTSGDTTIGPINNTPTEESSKQKKTTGQPSINISAVQRIIHHDLSITKKRAAEEEIMRKEWVATHKGDTSNKRKGFAREQFGKKPKKIVYDEDGNPIPTLVEQEMVECVEADPNAWREKIVLTAVECEWKDVELPEPTYPFKQPSFPRGDVVAGQKRKRGGGKKRKQQQEEYWEDCGYGQDDGYYQQQQQEGFDNWGNHDYYDDTTYPTNDQVANDTVMEDPTPVVDLPPLPADLSTLTPLTKPILPGTVVAFKQLTMDKNYTPVFADYRTAIIEEVIDDEPDGPFLVMRLAIRDRMEREVDKDTGERIMRKFEMPGDTRADEGKEELMWGELIEPLLVHLPESADTSANDGKNRGANNGDKDENGDNNVQGNMNNAARSDGNETQEAMGDAPNEEQKGETGKGKDEQPNSRQGTFNTTVDVVEEDNLSARIAATLEEEEERALLEELAAEMAMGEDEHPVVGISQEQMIDTPQDAQITNSPKYSHSYSEFKTPEPEQEAQADNTRVVDEESYAPSSPLEEEESAQQPAYESDSDGLPTLGSILASQSQRASVKRESQTHDEPQLPPLPVFSPFEIRVSQEEERPLDEQQIQQEVEGAKEGMEKGGPKNIIKSGGSQVQVIDLTVTSSDPAEMSKKRKRGKGRKRGGSDVWRAVKN